MLPASSTRFPTFWLLFACSLSTQLHSQIASCEASFLSQSRVQRLKLHCLQLRATGKNASEKNIPSEEKCMDRSMTTKIDLNAQIHRNVIREEKQKMKCQLDSVGQLKTSVPYSVSRSSFVSSLASLCAISSALAKPSSCSASDKHHMLPMERNSSGKDGSPCRPILSSTSTCSSSNTGDVATLQESFSGFVAGATLSGTKTLVKYPLDTATVRLQMPSSDYSIANLKRLFDGSFSGITAPLIANIPAGAVFFAVKDATKQALKERAEGRDMPKWIFTSLAVAAAQFPYWLMRNPSEVVKTRQQAGIPGYGEGTGAIEAIRRVVKEESIGGLYSGYWENIFYAYPADVIKFLLYDILSGGTKNLPPAQGAVYGAASTALAQLLTTPLDVVRNRVMAGEGISEPRGGEEATIKAGEESYFDCLTRLAREEGMTGLFAGSSPRVGKALLSGAIQFATYEETKQSIAGWFARKEISN